MEEEEEMSDEEDWDDDEEDEEEMKEREDKALDFAKVMGDVAEEIYCPYHKVYAHQVRPGRQTGDREDFTETLFYESFRNVKKDFEVEFYLNDAVSTFCVFIDGFTPGGIMGFSNTFLIQSLAPFYLEPKMPLELTFGDHFYLPSVIVNNMDQKIRAQVNVTAPKLIVPKGAVEHEMKPYERIGEYIEMKVEPRDDTQVTIKLDGRVANTSMQDSVTKKCQLFPFGFPKALDFSGRVDSSERKTFKFHLDQEIVPNSLSVHTKVYPGCLSSLLEGVESLIQQPGGCFEQTSMTMYPMIYALKFMKLNDIMDEKITKKANDCLENGYKRLIGYECKQKGFEWFGEDPGHEALTAMGILEFTDLSEIFPVDQEMIKRNVKWLVSRLNEEKDGFLRNKLALDYFGGAPEETTDAYIAYAISRSKAMSYEKIEKLVEKLEKKSYEEKRDDSYFICLTALTLFNFGLKERSAKLVEHFLNSDYQVASGKVHRSKTSITSSGGDDLAVQTTSLAVLSLLNFKEKYLQEAEMAIEYLNSMNRGGRFGSTQATVLALEALVAYSKATAETEAAGTIELEVNGKKLQKIEFGEGQRDSMYFDDVAKHLEQGKENVVTIGMTEGCRMPFSFQANYFTPKPDPNGMKGEKLKFWASLKNNVLKEGDLTEIEVELQNLDQEKAWGMTCVVLNLPSGLVARFERLEELKRTKVIDFFELMGSRKLVLYWRQILKGEKKSFLVDVVGDLPGRFVAMASYAYLYYEDAVKYFVDGFGVEIAKN